MRESLYDVLNDPKYKPVNGKSLARRVRVKRGQESEFEDLLNAEEAEGSIVCIRDGLYVLPQRVGLLAGKLLMNERGFGFLQADNYDGEDVHIPAEDTHVALHGDRVLVRLHGEHRRRRRNLGPSGEVIKVLKRARTQLVGTLQKSEMFHFVEPDDTRINVDIYVPLPKRKKIPLGHKVVVRLHDWPSPKARPEGTITEVLGPPSKVGVDMLSILRKYELPEDFPKEVEAEARSIPTSIPEGEVARRKDFRGDFVFTIDPDDARDFDDALSYRQLRNGDLEVFVHIADVSHYVRPGGAMDKEAQQRGNSTYLVDRVIPMLPEKLSNGICSLVPNADRLVKTVAVRLGPDGKIKRSTFHEGVIHSQKRLTYQEALGIIEGRRRDPASDYLMVLHDMAQKLRRRRFDDGALELDFPEVKVRLNETGHPIKFELSESDVAHQLIEEYMLLANEVVARHLKKTRQPAIYRVHEDPDPSRLDDLRANLQPMGIETGNLVQRGEIQKLLRSIRDSEDEYVVKINLLKSMRRAEYSTMPLGHFGLAKPDYAHFTSPIRRYADLVVHRALFAGNLGKGEWRPGSVEATAADLDKLAKHISTTERNSTDAERESVKLKKLQFLQEQSERKSGKASLRARVLDVRSFGLIVEATDMMLQGMVPISEIAGDVYHYDSRRLEYQGESTGKVLKPGSSLTVEVLTVDLDRLQVNFRCTRIQSADNRRPGSNRSKKTTKQKESNRPPQQKTGRWKNERQRRRDKQRERPRKRNRS